MKASNLLLAIYFNMVKIVYIVQDNTKLIKLIHGMRLILLGSFISSVVIMMIL